MATTDFLPFAIGSGALVASQATYAASSTLTNGFSVGIADETLANKAWRQGTMMAAGFANWMVQQGISVPDDGNLTNLVSEITSAFSTISGIHNLVAITTTGTWTVPAGITKVKYRVIGAGGGGGGAFNSSAAGGGGSGGGYSEGWATVTPAAGISCTIGAAGTAGTGATNGGTGGTTIFGSIAQATGGVGGSYATTGIAGPGMGGVGSVGTFNTYGAIGGIGTGYGSSFYGGVGASMAPYGQGGNVTANGAGTNALGYGSGGGGGAAGTNGGTGSQGLILLEY